MSRSILVVDDNEVDVLIARKNLERCGEFDRILTATDGAEAIEVMNAEQPDYILLDINMPVLDGWGFLDSLDDGLFPHQKLPKVFMLSSSIDEADSQRALNNPNVVQYIVKPLNSVKISQLLNV